MGILDELESDPNFDNLDTKCGFHLYSIESLSFDIPFFSFVARAEFFKFKIQTKMVFTIILKFIFFFVWNSERKVLKCDKKLVSTIIWKIPIFCFLHWKKSWIRKSIKISINFGTFKNLRGVSQTLPRLEYYKKPTSPVKG